MKNEIKLLFVLYFAIGIAEIIAEFYQNVLFIYILKPFILPVLGFIYVRSSLHINKFYLLALFFNLISNVFFITKDFNSILIGSIFHSLHRIFIILIIFKKIKIKNYFIVFLGSLPFAFIFGYTAFLTQEQLNDSILIYIFQSLILCIMGGLSVSNYIFENDKKSLYLLGSATVFELTQMLFVIRLYYLSIDIFQPLLMLLFILAQFLFYQFLIQSENDELLEIEIKQ